MKFNSNTRKVFVTILVLTLLLITFVAPVAAKSPGQAPNVQTSAQVTQAETIKAQVIADVQSASEMPVKDLALGGIYILGIVTGLVAWFKKIGVKGNWLTVAAMAIGLILGIGYQYYLVPLTTYTLWFFAALYGLSLGMAASGIYDAYGNGSTSNTTIANTISGVLSSEDQSSSTPTA